MQDSDGDLLLFKTISNWGKKSKRCFTSEIQFPLMLLLQVVNPTLLSTPADFMAYNQNRFNLPPCAVSEDVFDLIWVSV